MSETETEQHLANDVIASAEVGDVQAGNPLPIGGAHRQGRGINFVLFSRHATVVRLEFYQNADDHSPSRIIDFDPVRHRTGDVWHVWVGGILAGQLYGYRVEGPYLPEEGHRFNPHKLLLDPYARAIAGIENWDFLAARGYDSSSTLADLSFSITDNACTTPKCVFYRRPFRLGNGLASKAFRLRHRHLRDTRPWFQYPPKFGCAASWNLRWLDRKDPISPGPGSDRH